MKNRITAIFDDYFLTAKVLKDCCEMMFYKTRKTPKPQQKWLKKDLAKQINDQEVTMFCLDHFSVKTDFFNLSFSKSVLFNFIFSEFSYIFPKITKSHFLQVLKYLQFYLIFLAYSQLIFKGVFIFP